MNPRRVWAKNYRTFEDLDLVLPDGCLAVLGENGAGKSSIIQIIDLALFAARGELAQHLSDADTGDLEIGMEFDHAGDLYRIRRGYAARGRSGKTTLDFERRGADLVFTCPPGCGDTAAHLAMRHQEWSRDAGDWHPLTRDKADETQAKIEEVLGLSRATFRASAFLAQGDGAAFTEATPGRRKEVLAEVLDLGVWDRLNERRKHDQRAAEADVAKLDGETATLQAVVNGAPVAQARLDAATVALNAANGAAAAADTTLTALTEEWQTAQATLAQAQTLLAELRTAEAALTPLAEITREGAAAETQMVSIATERERVQPIAARLAGLEAEEAALRERVDSHALAAQTYEASFREYDLKSTQRNAILGQASTLNEKAHALREEATALEQRGPGDAHCRECGQTLGAEALASSLAAMRAEADELDAAAKDLDAQAETIALPEVGEKPADDAPTAELAAVQTRKREASEAATELRVLAEREAGLQAKTDRASADEHLEALAAATASKLEASEKAAGLTVPSADELEALKAKGLRARADIERLRTAASAATAEKAKAETQIEAVADAETKLADTATRRGDLHDELDLLASLERAYGRDGVPALIVENAAIPAIEVEASRILAELGTSFRVELRTQAALKSGEGLRDTLDVVVIGEAGERPYETFSGGERTRLNLALRIALARLLANRRGAESRLLAIDEPEFLDETGVAKLSDVLRGLLDDFDKIVLISHVPTLSEAFDQTLTVTKADGQSSVGSADAEPVAA